MVMLCSTSTLYMICTHIVKTTSSYHHKTIRRAVFHGNVIDVPQPNHQQFLSSLPLQDNSSLRLNDSLLHTSLPSENVCNIRHTYTWQSSLHLSKLTKRQLINFSKTLCVILCLKFPSLKYCSLSSLIALCSFPSL